MSIQHQDTGPSTVSFIVLWFLAESHNITLVASEYAIIAMECISAYGYERPTMEELVERLSKLHLDNFAKQPIVTSEGFFRSTLLS